MYQGSLYHGSIIQAFYENVPGVYVRDYRDRDGFIVICKDYKDLPWRDQTTSRKVYRSAPATTLVNLPKGYVTAATIFSGLRLVRTGWRREFRRAMRFLSEQQMRNITEFLGCGEVFPGIV